MAENMFDRFTVFFTGDTVFLDGTAFQLGQLTTDVLNLDSKVLIEVDRRIDDFMVAVWMLLQEKTDSAARSTQERLNAVWDLVFELPVYRNLSLDMETSRNLFPVLLSDRTKWADTLDVDSEGHRMFEDFLSGLEYFAESLRDFQGQIQGMLELYFEPLSRRSSEAYAEAYATYFTDMVAAGALLLQEQFSQSFPAQLCFVPMAHPTEAGKVLLAEKAEFSYLSHFLYTDFYRGLMTGNAPRRCHNCGRYFLLTAGYNTCYCNHVAPGETERTCRKVGAHRKANHPTGLSPAGMEYRKVYNRLKARKQRRKISTDEWNAALAQAQEVLDMAESGELSDEEMRERFRAF